MCHHNGRCYADGTYFFSHDDPQMFFDIPSEYAQICQAVEFGFEVNPMDANEVQQSLSELLESKSQEAEGLKDELTDIYVSSSWKLTRPLRRFRRIIKK